MTEKEILDQLTLIYTDVFGKNTQPMPPGTALQDIEGWNSLSNVQLVAETEKKFGVKFPFAEILAFDTVEDILKAVMKYKEK